MTIEHLIMTAKKSGQRMTPAKKKMLMILSQSAAPISAPEILSRMDINKSTLYRAIETLITCGIVTEIDFGDGKKRYELLRTNHHHHLICIQCHSVADYMLDGDLKIHEDLIEKRNKFKVIRHNLEFFGICRQCNSI